MSSDAGGSNSLFPCDLPYPEALRPPSGAVLDDEEKRLWAMNYLNVFVAWGNYVELGCPDCHGGSWEPPTVVQSRDVARRFADRLLGEVEEFASFELVNDSLFFEGSRHAVEQALRHVSCTAAGYVGGTADDSLSNALPVKAERVAMPEHAGMVDPLLLLPEDRREVVANLVALRRPEHLWEPMVRAFHNVPADEEAGLVKKLLEHKMVELVPESQLPHDSCGKMHPGGFFCVPKNETEDRLIYDRRPENSTMERISWAKLPAGACFCKMLLKPTEYLRGSGEDLRNYYYTLALPSSWVPYNAVGRRVDPKIVSSLGLDPNIPHRACLRVLGMGDRNACDIAQAVHEALLQRAGLMEEDTQLVYGAAPPRGSIWEGIYLDDLLVTQRCEHSSVVTSDFVPPSPDPGDEDMRRIEKARAAYEEAGLRRAVHKAFTGLTSFKAWGAEVDGIKGRVGAPIALRRQVWCLIHRMVKHGYATRHLLQKLLGFICFIFQYRRELFSLQHHIYKYMQTIPDKRWIKLPGFIRDELRSMAFHMAFAFTDMRRSLHNSLLATDALPPQGAVLERRPRQVWQKSFGMLLIPRVSMSVWMRQTSCVLCLSGRPLKSLQRWQAFWDGAWTGK